MSVQHDTAREKDQISYMITRTNKTEIAYANAAFAHATGYAIQEVIGSPFVRYLDPATPKAVGEDISATVLGGARWEGVLGVKRRDGSCLWALTSISPWYENGQLTGSTAVRTRASAKQIASAQRIHRLITKHPRRYEVKAGKLQFAGLAAIFNLFRADRFAFLAVVSAVTPALILTALNAALAAVGTQTTPFELIGAGLALSALAASVVVTVVRREVTAPLRRAINGLHLLSSGELQSVVKAQSHGDLAALTYALRLTQESLVSMIEEIRAGIASMTVSTTQLSAGNSDLSRRTESQAAATAQITASLGGLMDLVSRTAASAGNAERLADSAAQTSSRGNLAVEAVVECMHEIAQGARQMTEVMTTIEAIAAQTNLLALNAAVEAARAGEHGRGFSVVAKEVRVLANRAVEASSHIRKLIGASLKRTESGQTRVNAAAKAIDELGGAISNVNALMAEIAASSVHQNDALDEIHQALADIDETTQQNAALVEETSAATESLAAQARALAMTVKVFR